MQFRLEDLWSKLVDAAPRAHALTQAEFARVWSRAELDQLANGWKNALSTSVAHQRVSFALPNGPDWFGVFLGLLKAQAIPVPLDPTEPVALQRERARAAQASFAWIDGQLESTGLRPRVARQNRGACLIKLTSGSTGKPRALAFTHSQMIADGRQVAETMGILPVDTNYALIPLGHSYGLGNLVVPLLAQGTAIVCGSSPLPNIVARDLERWRPTLLPAVPALLRILAQSELGAETFRSVRVVISAGAPLPPEIAQAFFQRFGVRVHGFYGSSETGGISYDRSGDVTLNGTSVGTPMNGVSVTPTRGGRVIVSSPAVMTIGNRRRHDTFGLFRPADRVRITAEGELQLAGRTGRLVKISGRRIDLSELETTLRSTPGVTDAYAALHPERPDALAVVFASQLTPAEIRSLLKQRLAAWQMPSRVLSIRAFPLTARGKTDVPALQKLLSAPTSPANVSSAPPA